MNRFRPQNTPKQAVVKDRLRHSRVDNCAWQSRVKWYPVGWKFNHCVIGNQFLALHYLACHAPAPVQKKWQLAYQIFYKKHFGTKHATMRYLNQRSCHAWI